MSATTKNPNRPSHVELERMVELLANYICATDRPATVLATALATLQREVQDTQQAAVQHLHARATISM